MELYQWHKQASYKDFYESEMEVLQGGLRGDFKLLKVYDPEQVNGRVIILGELSFGQNTKQGIQIIFPTKYPFAPPKIISVIFSLDQDGNGPIQPVQFGKGNQYGDGALCLFPKDMWNKDQHGIGWVLRRAQKWLVAANSDHGFRPEEIVEEYPSLIPHIGQVLLPKRIILPDNQKTGLVTLTQFKPNHYIFEQNVIPESPFGLHIGKEHFKWYSFDPNVTLKSLFPVFNAQTIINVFSNYFSETIINGEEIKNVALHLPGEANPWHFFKLFIKKHENQVIIQPAYYIARIIDEELYLRTKDIFDNQILLQKRVTIIGLGAIGSEVAKSLAKNGIGHFNLFDSDTFEIGNSIRHAADLYYIGEDKVRVVKQLILRSNPNITVNSYKIDVLDDVGFLEKSLKESDLCIVLTAEDSVDYLMNDLYVKNFNIPFIFARVSAGAFSGGIQIVTSKTACLRCLSKHEVDTLPAPKEKVELSELKPEYGSCSTPALPGSEVDTKEVALQVTRIALQCLLEDKSSSYPRNHHSQYYWHGPYGSNEQAPFTWELKNHEKHKECKVCR